MVKESIDLLWWTSIDIAENGVLLKVGSRREKWNMSVDEASDVLEYRFRKNGNVFL